VKIVKINVKNEKVKRKCFTWLKHADGCCDSTINNIEKSILLYEDFTKQADFATFNPDKAMTGENPYLLPPTTRTCETSQNSFHGFPGSRVTGAR
jgi:hypothetical protein